MFGLSFHLCLPFFFLSIYSSTKFEVNCLLHRDVHSLEMGVVWSTPLASVFPPCQPPINLIQVGLFAKQWCILPPASTWELEDGGTANADGLSSLVTLLRYNACIHQCFDRRTKGAGNMVNGLASNAEIDDSSNCDATVVLLKKGNQGEPVPKK